MANTKRNNQRKLFKKRNW
jgi:hypothetical protein